MYATSGHSHATETYGFPWNLFRRPATQQVVVAQPPPPAPVVYAQQAPPVVYQQPPSQVVPMDYDASSIASSDSGYKLSKYKDGNWRWCCIALSIVLALLLLAGIGVGIWAILTYAVPEGANCGSSPCRNGGLCREVLNNGVHFECSCPAGYQGMNCETAVNLCIGDPCMSRPWTTCMPTPGSYVCDCVAGYMKDSSGFCVAIDPCSNSPCSSVAYSQCVVAGGTYRCDCVSGYIQDGSGNCVVGNNNYALSGTASQSCNDPSSLYPASNAIDGSSGTSANTCVLTCSEAMPWWVLTLPNAVQVNSVRVLNAASNEHRFDNVVVRVGNDAGTPTNNPICKSFQGYLSAGAEYTLVCDSPLTGNIVSIHRTAQLSGETNAPFNFCEIEVYGP